MLQTSDDRTKTGEEEPANAGVDHSVPEGGEGFWLEAPPDQLEARLRREVPTLAAARLVLRNRLVTVAVVEHLVGVPQLRSSYRWRLDLAQHALVPLSEAMALVPGLYWRDLAMLALQVRVRPQLRRQAEQLLLQRLPKLALGERITLARVASHTVVTELRKDSNPRVLKSLLENPRLRESDLMPLAMSGGTAVTLRVLLADKRWGVRYNMRRAVVRNPRVPVDLALAQLASLSKRDLQALARDPRVADQVKRRCRVLLGETP